QGVVIRAKVFAGFIWSENVGWISVGNGAPAGPGGLYANTTGSDFGVNIDSDGELHGLGWGENIGWINFDGGGLAPPPQPARIDCSGRLMGFAWGENVGWINLADLSHYVALTSSSVPVLCDLNHNGVADGDDIGAFMGIVITGQATWLDV